MEISKPPIAVRPRLSLPRRIPLTNINTLLGSAFPTLLLVLSSNQCRYADVMHEVRPVISVGSRPSVVMTSWIHTRNQAYLGIYIRCVAYRISDIRRSAGLKIRFYNYNISVEIRLFDILGFYDILIYF